MRIFTLPLLIFLFLSPTSYNLAQTTYEEHIAECLENAKKREFIYTATNKKSYSYSNVASPTCLIGATLPDFFTKAMDNSIVSNKQLYGKINILNFWFIKCKPCIEEIPTLNKLVEKYSVEDVNFLAFTRDDSTQLYDFLERQPFHFTIIPNSKTQLNHQFKNLWGYPYTIITNKENIIIEVITGKAVKQHSLDWLGQQIETILEKEQVYSKD